MDKDQAEQFNRFRVLRLLYSTNNGNPEGEKLLEEKLIEMTVPASDIGRILSRRYEWVIPYESGLINVDTTSYIECEILCRGHYAPQLVDTIKGLLKPGSVAIDIGANIGCLTLPMAQQVGPTGRVIAFEPEPECFGRLKQNILLNRLPQVSMYQLAISDNDGTHTLFLKSEGTANRAGASLQQGVGFTREVQIKTTRVNSISEFADLARCDLIKIDTEGHELVVLKQMKEIISRFQPHVIFEYEETTWRLHGQSYAEATALMESLGYKLYAMDGHMMAPISPTNPYGRDILCVPTNIQ